MRHETQIQLAEALMNKARYQGLTKNAGLKELIQKLLGNAPPPIEDYTHPGAAYGGGGGLLAGGGLAALTYGGPGNLGDKHWGKYNSRASEVKRSLEANLPANSVVDTLRGRLARQRNLAGTRLSAAGNRVYKSLLKTPIAAKLGLGALAGAGLGYGGGAALHQHRYAG